MACCLTPQVPRQTACMQQSTNALEYGPISPFGYSILGRRVMNSKLLFCSPRLQVVDKFFTRKFAATIRVQNLDTDTKLRLAPCIVLLVHVKHVALGT